MQDIADAAGVSRSTVSKALRDDPTIPAARRRQIKATAARLNYRPNPLVAALMESLRGRRRNSDPFSLAWIDLWTAADLKANDNRSALLTLSNAEKRAKELGYKIEVYRPAIDGISPTRLRQVLLARMQTGVIFPPVPGSAARYPLDMTELTGVTIGSSLREPPMHRVSSDHFGAARLACQMLRAKGLQRIGLVLSPWIDERTKSRWQAGYLIEQREWPEEERLPPLLVPSGREDLYSDWAGQWKPDAIVASEAHVGAWSRRQSGGSVRIGWLGLSIFKRGIWGVDYCAGRMGVVAVELVVGQIHRNERGNPDRPNTLLIEGHWIER